MAVDKGIQTGNMGNGLLGSPGLGSGIVTQVAQGNDLGRTGSLGCVDGCLHIRVQRGAVLTAGNAVDVVAGIILEVGGGGLGEGLGGGDAHDGHNLAAEGKGSVGGKYVFALHAVLLMVEVAGDIGVLCQVDDLHAAVHVVVELVVAQSCHIIACRIHQLDNGFALVHGAVGSALNMVAGINQQNILVLLLQLCLHRGDHIVAQNTVDVGMYVVGVENCDVTLGCLCFGGCFHHGFRCGHGVCHRRQANPEPSRKPAALQDICA